MSNLIDPYKVKTNVDDAEGDFLDDKIEVVTDKIVTLVVDTGGVKTLQFNIGPDVFDKVVNSDEWDALIGADTPNSGNVYMTASAVATLISAIATVYTADGQLTSNRIVDGVGTYEFNFATLKYFGLSSQDGVQIFNNNSGNIWLHNQVAGAGADVQLSSLNRNVTIQGIAQPNADGNANQIVFTDGANQLGFKDLTVESTIDPTVNDDFTQGYYFGLVWTNTTSGDQFVMWRGTTGTALWLPLSNNYTFNAEGSATQDINAGGVVALTLTANLENDPFSIFTSTAGTTDITINQKGSYLIEHKIYAVRASGTNANIACLAYRNGGLLRKSAAATSWSNNQTQQSMYGLIEIDLDVGDVIKYQCVRVGSATTVINTTANQCQFLVTLLRPMI